MNKVFDQSIGDVARDGGVSLPTIRTYCALGLLEHIRLSTGVRLFDRDAAARVREIAAQRIANRGRRAVAA